MDVKKLKIAIFHLGFFFSGGGERLVIEEAKGLVRLGHDVNVFVPIIDRKKCFPELLTTISSKRLFFPLPFHFPLRDFIAITGAIVSVPLTFWKFTKYDIFFGANQPGPLICYLLHLLLGKPYIIYLAQPTRLFYPRRIDKLTGFGKGSFNMFYMLARYLRRVLIPLDLVSIRHAEMVLTNGEYVSKKIKKVYSVETVNCPAGAYTSAALKTSRFQGWLKCNSLILNKPYILLTNRHFPQKRFDYIILALPEIIKLFPQIQVVITGDWTTYTHYLKKLIKKMDLGKHVCFTGLTSELQLKELYQNAAVYVYTAPDEDFGMGVIEAMGFGIPVVAWDASGPATTVIHEKLGYLAPPYNIKKFSDMILRLLQNQEQNQKIGRAAKDHIKKKYLYSSHLKILNSSLQNTLKSYYAK